MFSNILYSDTLANQLFARSLVRIGMNLLKRGLVFGTFDNIMGKQQMWSCCKVEDKLMSIFVISG